MWLRLEYSNCPPEPSVLNTPLDSTGKSLTLQDLVVSPKSLSQVELHGADRHKGAMSKVGTGCAHSTVLELTTTPLHARGHTV